MKLLKLTKQVNLVYSYLQGIIGLSHEDVIFTSYPKSGNTWVRFFLCNLISLKEWGGKTVDFEVLDRTMPELGVSNLIKEWEYSAIPRVVKTHKSFWPVFKRNRRMLLVRDPRDVMVSYYKFEMGRKRKRFDDNFSEFVHDSKFGLEAWAKHYISWKEKAGLVTRFEDMKEDDVKEFRRITNFLNISVDEDIFIKAVERSRFKNVKKVEEKRGLSKTDTFGENFKFARKGKSEQWQQMFSKNDLKYYQKVLMKYDINIYKWEKECN